jgi:tRNA nucleotidyltransferase (CCA-adding enzyme)
MKIFLVGGAVRDELLGHPIKERDWVVVGATEKHMLDLGYRQVGKEFPVFLHPRTREEYALARMERKVAKGYKGFHFDTSTNVTLAEDLERRDLTINAMAKSPEGELIDPYHGKADLDKRILRHVSKAFAEDPVRILRVGRFLARYHHLGFQVAPETLALMRAMTDAGEVDALVPERVWKELERALGEPTPAAFFEVLHQAHALHRLLPGLTIEGAGLHALIHTAKLSPNATARFAALLYAYPETAMADPQASIAALCRRTRAPNAYRDLALLTAKHYRAALQADTATPEQLLALFSGLDIYRRESRFHDFLAACAGIAAALHLPFNARLLETKAAIVKAVPIAPLLTQGLHHDALAAAIHAERLAALNK